MANFWEKASSLLLRFIKRNPYFILVTGLVFGFFSIVYTKGHLEVWTERNVLISQQSQSAKHYSAYRKEFKDDYLIVVLSSKDLDQAKRFAASLGERLQVDTEAVQEAFYRIPAERFKRQALLFLTPDEIDDLGEKLSQHQELLHRLAASPGLFTLLQTMNERISRALIQTAVSGLFTEDEVDEEKETGEGEADPEDLKVLSAIMDSLYLWLTDEPRYQSPWSVFFKSTGGLSEDGFLVDEKHGWVFVLAYLKNMDGSFIREGKAIQRIRGYIEEISIEIPQVSSGITGIPALNSEEMACSMKDMSRAMGLALVLIILLFSVGFGRVRRPFIAVLVLILGIIWTMGWLSLTIGHLTILSMAFGSILIGLGVDFAIHLLARYEKERRVGSDTPTALAAAFSRVGRAIFSGALTTAAAFFALGFSSFRGLKEFGWIAGWGILFCLVAELLVLPTLLLILDRRKATAASQDDQKGLPQKAPLLERIWGPPSRYPRTVLFISLGLALTSVFFIGRVGFDYNLLHLQPKGTEAVEWELKLLEAAGNSSIFAAEVVDSLEEARRKTKAYEALSLVNRVESLASYLPKDTAERMARIAQLKPMLDGVALREKPASAPSAKRLRRYISKIRFKLREDKTDTPGNNDERDETPPPDDTMTGARFRLDQVHGLLEKADEEATAPVLNRYQAKLFADFRQKMEILETAVTAPQPLTFEDLPALLKKRFFGKTGKWLLQIYPEEDIWQLAPQKRFVDQLRSVSEKITGTAVVNYEATRSLLEAYLQGGLFSCIAILIILFIDFRHPLLVLLTLIPLVLAGFWTLLGMQVFGIVFNPANLVIIPLLVGIGVDNGIHVIRHFLGADSAEAEIAGTSIGRAITLSSLTTMAGFGSLAIARHQGIHSIGLLLSLAMGSCLVASLMALPAIIRLLPKSVRHRLWLLGQPRRE